jgi:hypothetical protein
MRSSRETLDGSPSMEIAMVDSTRNKKLVASNPKRAAPTSPVM